MEKRIPKQIVRIEPFSVKQSSIYADWINPDIKYLVVCCGRQVGKSYAAIVIALKTALNPSIIKSETPLKSCSIAYFMPYNDGAKMQYEKAVNFLGNTLHGTKFNSTYKTIKFNNGSKIRFYGAENETSIRGNTFDFIIVDEACYVKDEVWQASITPTISRAMAKGYGKVLLASTPKNKNWFYDYFNNTSKDFKQVKFTSYESGLSGDVIKEVDKQKALLPKAIFENEYMAEFLEGSRGMFDLDRIIFNKIETITDLKGVVAAVDWGMENDYTVLSILNAKKQIICIQRWRKVEWHTVISEINTKLREYGNPLVYAEKNGIGNMPTKELKRLYGATYEWITTAANKTEIITRMSKDLLTTKVQDKLYLPDIDYVKEEFGNFGFHYENGNMKFGNMKKDINDDTVMSIAIANANFKTFSLSF
jgi:hypothetical protein